MEEASSSDPSRSHEGVSEGVFEEEVVVLTASHILDNSRSQRLVFLVTGWNHRLPRLVVAIFSLLISSPLLSSHLLSSLSSITHTIFSHPPRLRVAATGSMTLLLMQISRTAISLQMCC
jgi:hypothetical protein